MLFSRFLEAEHVRLINHKIKGLLHSERGHSRVNYTLNDDLCFGYHSSFVKKFLGLSNKKFMDDVLLIKRFRGYLRNV